MFQNITFMRQPSQHHYLKQLPNACSFTTRLYNRRSMKENTLGVTIPADVPHDKEHDYLTHYATITKNTGRLMLFACDQKIEHMNHDFYGEGIHPDAMHPEHLFNIASQGTIGAMATQMGLLARYGKLYPTVPYIVKL